MLFSVVRLPILFRSAPVSVSMALPSSRMGLSLIAAGHYATEFPVTAAVAEKLRRAFPELEVLVSEDARDPYTYL